MKKFFVIALMMVLGTATVFGQALPNLVGGGFTSPQAAATNGRLRSAADDFMRPDSFKNVNFENWFAMTSFASGSNAGLGYATKVGGLYLGMFYYGSFWNNIQTFDYTESRNTWHGEAKNGIRSYEDLPSFNANRPLNQVAVLIGLEDMGFRFTFTSSYKYFQDSDFIADGAEYKSYEMGNGALSPQLAWSMTKNLAEKGVKPWATIDLVFNNTFAKGQQYADAGASYAAGNEIVTNSNNFTRIDLNLGLGGYTLANNNGWRTSFDLEYRLGLNLYDSEYTYTDAGSGYTKIKSISGRNTEIGGDPVFDEYSSSNHRIRPIISTQWNGEALRLRAKLDLNINITTTETTEVQTTANGSLEKDGDATTVTVLGFNPDLNLGAQWQIHPRLFLNMGARININALNITTTEGASYTADKKDENSGYTTTASSFGGTANTLTLGVTFNPRDNLSVEAACGVTGNNISVFSDTGLFSFANILVKLTF